MLKMLPSGSLNQATFKSCAVGDVQIALQLHPRHVVVLEGDALRLQRVHFALDVVDRPGDGGRLVRARVLRAVDVEARIAALVHDDLVALGVDLLQAERAFVELLGRGADS